MTGPGSRTIAVGAVALLGLLGLAGWKAESALDAAFGPPDDHVAADDPRVCAGTSGNNTPLAEATGHFGLAVPSAATDLVFTANSGGLSGGTTLSMRFTTTPADLTAFLAAGRFEPPGRTTRLTVGGWQADTPGAAERAAEGPCGLTPPVGPAMAYSQDDRGKSPRALAVDATSDPARPVVWVTALDL
ncbi:hypothetical protein ACIRBX_28205 [Kitasatospora sp. NPDC096147]|uniref:hypothetical protein n=1 Tax=Kitasatospora sp. NPDC096147 TaxID=3364093 RepID=UPI003803C7C9